MPLYFDDCSAQRLSYSLPMALPWNFYTIISVPVLIAGCLLLLYPLLVPASNSSMATRTGISSFKGADFDRPLWSHSASHAKTSFPRPRPCYRGWQLQGSSCIEALPESSKQSMRIVLSALWDTTSC